MGLLPLQGRAGDSWKSHSHMPWLFIADLVALQLQREMKRTVCCQAGVQASGNLILLGFAAPAKQDVISSVMHR